MPSAIKITNGARSHRSRGAWIEIFSLLKQILSGWSHRSRGAWIEIQVAFLSDIVLPGRIAHAVRGLK